MENVRLGFARILSAFLIAYFFFASLAVLWELVVDLRSGQLDKYAVAAISALALVLFIYVATTVGFLARVARRRDRHVGWMFFLVFLGLLNMFMAATTVLIAGPDRSVVGFLLYGFFITVCIYTWRHRAAIFNARIESPDRSFALSVLVATIFLHVVKTVAALIPMVLYRA